MATKISMIEQVSIPEKGLLDGFIDVGYALENPQDVLRRMYYDYAVGYYQLKDCDPIKLMGFGFVIHEAETPWGTESPWGTKTVGSLDELIKNIETHRKETLRSNRFFDIDLRRRKINPRNEYYYNEKKLYIKSTRKNLRKIALRNVILSSPASKDETFGKPSSEKELIQRYAQRILEYLPAREVSEVLLRRPITQEDIEEYILRNKLHHEFKEYAEVMWKLGNLK